MVELIQEGLPTLRNEGMRLACHIWSSGFKIFPHWWMISFWSGFKPSLKWYNYSLLRIDGKWISYPIYLSLENWNTCLPLVFSYFLLSPWFLREITDRFSSLTCLFSDYPDISYLGWSESSEALYYSYSSWPLNPFNHTYSLYFLIWRKWSHPVSQGKEENSLAIFSLGLLYRLGL